MKSMSHSCTISVCFIKLNLWSPALLILFGCCITRNRTKAIDVREIEKALGDTAELNDKIANDLEKAKENNDVISGKVNEVMVYFAEQFKELFE